MSAPAGPVPLIPNRLWSLIASALWPQPDSSIAWAIVTAAGMPYRLCMAMAPGAIWLMNACWEAVPGTCVASAAGTCLVYDGGRHRRAARRVGGGRLQPRDHRRAGPPAGPGAVPGRRSAPGRGPFSRSVTGRVAARA